jgi:mRNA interferase RelE/StbE
LAWSIKVTQTATKQLSKLDRSEAKRITSFLRDRVTNLANPRDVGKALTGNMAGLWRYRVGDFRVICELQDNELVVLVVELGNRREIYR